MCLRLNFTPSVDHVKDELKAPTAPWGDHIVITKQKARRVDGPKFLILLEATIGIEPMNGRFAVFNSDPTSNKKIVNPDYIS